MELKRKISEGILEYEPIPVRRDIQVSKAFETPRGDRIRVVQTADNSAVITSIDQANPGLDMLIITAPPGVIVEKGFVGELWDRAKKAAIDVAQELLGVGNGDGGKQKCTTTTQTVNFGPDGKIQSVTTKTESCTPSPA